MAAAALAALGAEVMLGQAGRSLTDLDGVMWEMGAGLAVGIAVMMLLPARQPPAA